MRVLNYGSLNYDDTYTVPHMVQQGETLMTETLVTHCGGKGLNQSLALARAGTEVFHAGMVGEDGDVLLDLCKDNGIDFRHIRKCPGRSGHAIIQVNQQGDNCILLYKGANGMNSREQITLVLDEFDKGDLLVLQNEINELKFLMEEGYKRGLSIILNPSPFNQAIMECDLNQVSMLLLNEIEGFQMTGEREPEEILKKLGQIYPETEVVLTMGKAGSCYRGKEGTFFVDSFQVKAIDTTAAGDTFTGYLIGSMLRGECMESALKVASAASAVAVTRNGAASSIPIRTDVMEFLKSRRN